MARLANKIALTTGGSRGIGLAIAQLFPAGGPRVAITAADKGRLEAARSTLGPEMTASRPMPAASTHNGVAGHRRRLRMRAFSSHRTKANSPS
jgi:NAD(P)-dependent dehydrogenase (short-subunit alcohol dehydrogenase family)